MSPCLLTISFRYFREPCCLRIYYSLANLNIEAGISSERLVRNCQSTRSNVSEDCNINLQFVPSNWTHCHQIMCTSLPIQLSFNSRFKPTDQIHFWLHHRRSSSSEGRVPRYGFNYFCSVLVMTSGCMSLTSGKMLEEAGGGQIRQQTDTCRNYCHGNRLYYSKTTTLS